VASTVDKSPCLSQPLSPSHVCGPAEAVDEFVGEVLRAPICQPIVMPSVSFASLIPEVYRRLPPAPSPPLPEEEPDGGEDISLWRGEDAASLFAMLSDALEPLERLEETPCSSWLQL